jgi:release factor glutamine methyltransferase
MDVKKTNMNLKSIQDYFRQELNPLYDSQEVDVFFFWILETCFQCKKIDFVLGKDKLVSAADSEKWNQYIDALKSYEPIQYLIGTTHFYGLDFKVNSNTLIPRPETEELVDWMLKDIANTNSGVSNLKILDIGTGSGCIPITLAKHLPLAKIVSMDVSESALEVAQQNADSNEVEVDFILQNILELDCFPNVFDIIVSNPPYVRNSEKKYMKTNVLEYEPSLALFVSDEDPLIFYRKIAVLAHQNLNEDGLLYFEINQYLAQETHDMLVKLGFQNIELKNDFRGNPRMMRVKK